MSLTSREPLEGEELHKLDAAGTEQVGSWVAKDGAAHWLEPSTEGKPSKFYFILYTQSKN